MATDDNSEYLTRVHTANVALRETWASSDGGSGMALRSAIAIWWDPVHAPTTTQTQAYFSAISAARAAWEAMQ